MLLTAYANPDDNENFDAGEVSENMLESAGIAAASAADDSPADDSPADAKPAAEPASLLAPNKIKTVHVTFTSALRDANHRVMPHGNAVATFGDGSTLSAEVTGGAHVPTYGITDAVTNHPVTRIEGSGYRNHKGQPMPYAVFYNGGEALHVGRLDFISHGCVHVGDTDKMRKLNQGSAIGKTKVTVTYGPGVLDKIWNQHM